MNAPTGRLCMADDENERGSILPLVAGYIALALIVLLVCVNATSLSLAQRRLDALADAAAIAGSDGFAIGWNGSEPVAVLDEAGVREQAESIVSASRTEAEIVSADTPDGTSARVTLSAVWHPLIVSVFVPSGVALQSTATSRTALR